MPPRTITKTSATKPMQSVENGFASRPREQPWFLRDQTQDGVPSVPRASAHETGPGIAVGDWESLFSAVKERLIRTVHTPNSGQDLAADQAAARTRTDVMECVAALDQLHATVTAEFVRREGLELEVFDAKASVAQIRAALLGTQEGERRALHLAAHDSLTMLPNRGALIERITHELGQHDSRHNSFAVMFLDLDGFKPINDTHGHAAGDEMLQIVAARLRRVVRAQDLVSRIGGDEFACLIGGLTDQASLAHLADKLADAISAPCVLSTGRSTVRVSIGIAVAPADGSSANTLLENADLAMYAAKRQQARHAFFSPGGEDILPALKSPAPAPPQRPPE